MLIESKIHSSDASPKLLRDPPFYGRIQTTFFMYTVVISLHIHADSNYTSHRVYLADGVGPQHTSFPQCPLAPIHPRPVQSSHRRKNLLSNSNIRPPKTTNPRTPRTTGLTGLLNSCFFFSSCAGFPRFAFCSLVNLALRLRCSGVCAIVLFGRVRRREVCLSGKQARYSAERVCG